MNIRFGTWIERTEGIIHKTGVSKYGNIDKDDDPTGFIIYSINLPKHKKSENKDADIKTTTHLQPTSYSLIITWLTQKIVQTQASLTP